MLKELPKEIDDLIKSCHLELLDCELTRIYVRRNEITGRLDEYHHPYELVIDYPVSMGERGLMMSLYYDDYPTGQQLYQDVRDNLKDYLKDAGNGAYDELRAKAIKKALNKAPTKLDFNN